MSNCQVEYCRAKSEVEVTERNYDGETIIYGRQRKGISTREKFLLVCVVVLAFLCAVFTGLYFSERQHRLSKKKAPFDANGKYKHPGISLHCSLNEARRQAGLGRNIFIFIYTAKKQWLPK